MDYLDEYIQRRIYKLVWKMNMKKIIDEIHSTVPLLIYSNYGVYFFIGFDGLIVVRD